MKNDDLMDAVGKIDDKFIEKTAATREKRKKRKNIFIKAVAVAACICLLISGVLYGLDKDIDENPIKLSAYAIEEAVYPEEVAYADCDEDFESYGLWLEAYNVKRELIKGNENSIDDFIKKSTSVFLSANSGSDKNAVFSPTNLFMALSVLAETTDGSSRKQILDTIGVETIEELRDIVNKIWRSNYFDDGCKSCIMANSLWLSDGIEYNEKTFKTLAQNYFASSFKGEMGSEDYNKEYGAWLSRETGGELDEYIDDEPFSENTALAIASTMKFSAVWREGFHADENTKGIFHSPTGDKEVEFMNKKEEIITYLECSDFKICSQSFSEGGRMLFVLPDEGVSVYDVIKNGELYDSVSSEDFNTNWDDVVFADLSIPRFDISSKTDLIDGLKSLGINDVFDKDESDFSPAFKDYDAYVEKADQAATISIDENGCKATVFTEVVGEGLGDGPEKRVNIIFDRPFIVIITGMGDIPLFFGIVNNVQ